MAVARCDEHGPPVGLKQDYPYLHLPKPGKRASCGALNCAKQAKVWLTDAEQQEYLSGKRSFSCGYRSIELSDSAGEGHVTTKSPATR